MATKKLKTFRVEARIHCELCITIEAESLEDAVIKSKELKVDDFIEAKSDDGCFNDYDHKITGIFSNYETLKA